jgi:RNA polymerase sigma-70 factor (ECF subfamily)
VEFFSFDLPYLERLRAGDLATEQHFVAYFEQLLRIKLRSRMLPSDKVEDLRQETFIRVIALVRKDGVRQPERFGAFVNSICNNVLLEHYRATAKSQLLEDSDLLEIPDKVLDLEGALYSKESAKHVRQILDEMPKRDRDLLRAIFFDEKEKDAICAELGVNRDYLRVLLLRAKDKFKVLYNKTPIGMAQRATGSANR